MLLLREASPKGCRTPSDLKFFVEFKSGFQLIDFFCLLVIGRALLCDNRELLGVDRTKFLYLLLVLSI